MTDNQLLFAPQPTAADDSAKRTCRILVVDDDGDLRHLIAHALIESGYAVDAAEDGTRAWEALQVNSYDLLITDNDMPGFTGVELLLKLQGGHLEVPVIMVTTAIPDQEFAKRPGLMPEAILLKPLVIEKLLGQVKTVLEDGYRARNELQTNWQNRPHVSSANDSVAILPTMQNAGEIAISGVS